MDAVQTKSVFREDLMVLLRRREIWLCAICLICGYQLFYATYSFSAYLQQHFGLSAVMVGTITLAKLWMRPIGGIAGIYWRLEQPRKSVIYNSGARLNSSGYDGLFAGDLSDTAYGVCCSAGWLINLCG